MRIDIITVFPEMISTALDHSIIKRAMERRLVAIRVVNLRDYTEDKHRKTDDMPYGGGGGMVMQIGPIARAIADLSGQKESGSEPGGEIVAANAAKSAKSAIIDETDSSGVPSIRQDAENVSSDSRAKPAPRIAITDPRGPKFTQETARKWAREPHLILLCGHYEGVDERVRRHLVTDEISIGDYILTGGELPALVITDALVRLQAGALGDADAPDKDTFTENLLEYPHYTRPRDFNGWTAPDVLVNGHHALIERWRRWHQLRDTRQRRPDLFATLTLSEQDLILLRSDEPTAPSDLKILRSRKTGKAPRDEVNTKEEENGPDETGDSGH